MSPSTAYRLALSGTILGALLLVWLGVGVGIIGADGDPANRMYFGVIAVGVVGALVARLRPMGMARVLVAMALGQAAIGLVAIVGGLGRPWSGPAELALLNGFFVAAFGASAWLFRRAAAPAAPPLP
jgi:hypothetical protein